ncbi:hypothetical protein DE146DRAFT_649380 [Phaeosphaeria sp. MPI-PUGE-AT-0046c]|nr:hypothetical protein DE146DRAFT_649380 [Phaeosphaeria sp. MPI-PUGE-AT-0046c]
MDPQTDLPDLVEDLEVNIDELTEALAPLLNTQLSTTASSLPLLDKAKLYVLAAYSVESLLYSTLQASGVNAKEHAIFKELARLKGYFGKIKFAEERMNAPAAPKAKLDVGAAARFIKHGLAGNEKYDLERAERLAKERARAQLKARQINKKFDDNGEEAAAGKKREIQDVEPVVEHEGGDVDEDAPTIAQPSSKKIKVASEDVMDVDSAPSPTASHASSKKKSKKGKRGSKASKSTDPSDNDESSPSQSQNPSQDDTAPSTARPKRKQRGKKTKKDASADEQTADAAEEESSTPARTTRRQAALPTDPSNNNDDAAQAPSEKPKRGRGRPRKAK